MKKELRKVKNTEKALRREKVNGENSRRKRIIKREIYRSESMKRRRRRKINSVHSRYNNSQAYYKWL